MCAFLGVRDAKLLAQQMADAGVPERTMIEAQPVFDSVPDDEAERVWRAIVATARGSQA